MLQAVLAENGACALAEAGGGSDFRVPRVATAQSQYHEISKTTFLLVEVAHLTLTQRDAWLSHATG